MGPVHVISSESSIHMISLVFHLHKYKSLYAVNNDFLGLWNYLILKFSKGEGLLKKSWNKKRLLGVLIKTTLYNYFDFQCHNISATLVEWLQSQNRHPSDPFLIVLWLFSTIPILLFNFLLHWFISFFAIHLWTMSKLTARFKYLIIHESLR